MRQFWRKLRLRASETAPLQLSVRRAVEHRGLMAVAIGDLDLANTTTLSVSSLDRGWTMYAHTQPRGVVIDECADRVPVERVWEALGVLHHNGISHGDLRARLDNGRRRRRAVRRVRPRRVRATDVQLQADIAQLLVTTSRLYDAESAVRPPSACSARTPF